MTSKANEKLEATFTICIKIKGILSLTFKKLLEIEMKETNNPIKNHVKVTSR